MKKIFKSLMACLILLSLAGCGTHAYENYADGQMAISQSNQQMVADYFKKRAETDKAVMLALSNRSQLTGDNSAILLYSILSSQNDQKMLTQFKAEGLVKPTTDADIGVAFMNNTIPTMVRWGAGAFMVSEVVDGMSAAGTAISMSGEGNTVVSGSEVSSSMNSLSSSGEGSQSISNTKTASTSDNTTNNGN